MTRLLLLLLALATALPLAFAGALTPAQGAALRGTDFIRTTQQSDGGFGGFGPGQTMDAVFALRSAGIDPATVTRGGKSPADYLRANAASLTSPASAAKGALGAVALGLNPRSVGGVDLIAGIRSGLDVGTGRFADDDFSQAVAIIGLACTGNSVPGTAVFALRAAQLDDGSWGFDGFADPDTTAIALQALTSTGIGPADGDVREAVAFLRATQAADGGWGFDPAASNASTTAYVIQGLLSAAEDPSSAAYSKPGGTPLSFLLSQQQTDGSFIGFDAAFSTNQTVPALAGRTFCSAPSTPFGWIQSAVEAEEDSGPDVTPAPTTAIVAPLPPATGTGTRTGYDGHGGAALLAFGALVLAAAGVVALRKG